MALQTVKEKSRSSSWKLVKWCLIFIAIYASLYILNFIVSSASIGKMSHEYNNQLDKIATDGLGGGREHGGGRDHDGDRGPRGDRFDDDGDREGGREYGDGYGEWSQEELEWERQAEQVQGMYFLGTFFALAISLCCLVCVCGGYLGCYYVFHSNVKTSEILNQAYGDNAQAQTPQFVGGPAYQ